MIAYNTTTLSHIRLLKKAKEWHAKQLLSAEQMANIKSRYTIDFYTPNLFIKAGLFLFTWFAIGAAILLFGMLFSQALESLNSRAATSISCLLLASACLFLLETFIKRKKLYRSGIDEALLYAALLFISAALGSLLYNASISTNTFLLFFSFLLLPFLVAAVVRYADGLVTLVLCICSYTIFFLCILKLGAIAKMIMPFALMLLSVFFYIIAKRLQKKLRLQNWTIPIAVVECVGVFFFYLSGNYYVIRESSVQFFDMHISAGNDIPLAILFYLFTTIVPVVYVVYGLKQKDRLLLWIGLLTIALSAVTFKYYFSTAHPEILLIVAGLIAIGVAYAAIKYLRTPKHGITFEEEPHEDNFLQTNAEALLQAKTFGHPAQGTPVKHATEFDGGSSGGAGATESW